MVAIQPCALLLLIGPDWRIETVSANVGTLGNGAPESLVGLPLTELLDGDAIHTLRNRMAWLSGEDSLVRDYGVIWGNATYDIQARRYGNHYLIEAEIPVEARLSDAIGIAQSMMDRVTGNDGQGIGEQGLRQLRALTGFDSVILCDRHGTVRAVSDQEYIQALGTSRLDGSLDGSVARIIADRDANALGLVGNRTNPSLERSTFRAPDEAERARLSALAIAATMSLPLQIDGELVGAIHTHHGSPRRCGAERRAVAGLFADQLAARMVRAGWTP